jgi:hypothetical protein
MYICKYIMYVQTFSYLTAVSHCSISTLSDFFPSNLVAYRLKLSGIIYSSLKAFKADFRPGLLILRSNVLFSNWLAFSLK